MSVALEAKHRVVADRMNTAQSPVNPLDQPQDGVKDAWSERSAGAPHPHIVGEASILGRRRSAGRQTGDGPDVPNDESAGSLSRRLGNLRRRGWRPVGGWSRRRDSNPRPTVYEFYWRGITRSRSGSPAPVARAARLCHKGYRKGTSDATVGLMEPRAHPGNTRPDPLDLPTGWTWRCLSTCRSGRVQEWAVRGPRLTPTPVTTVHIPIVGRDPDLLDIT